jgi:hypothetical protein
MKLVLFIDLIMRNIVRLKEFLIALNQPVVISNNKRETKNSAENMFGFHLEELPVFLKIILARTIIAKFCQNDKVTPNQDKINPSNHASKKREATTTAPARMSAAIVVEVFIDQAATAPEGISTTSGSLVSSN